MNKTLLDTDILSEVGKAIDPTVTQHATAYRQAHGFLTLSVISVMEVIQGYHRVGAARRIQAFRNAIAAEEVLLFDQATADLAGHIAGDLDRVGRPIGRCDPIAATSVGQAVGPPLARRRQRTGGRRRAGRRAEAGRSPDSSPIYSNRSEWMPVRPNSSLPASSR